MGGATPSLVQFLRRWVVVGNWTVYIDLPVPLTERVVSLDLGAHPSIGWRYKR